MRTFVLVHGACHSAWYWEPLVAELRAAGDAAIAPELPSEDPTADLEKYAQIVLDAIPSTAEHVVVVGHSLGGLTVPIVANVRPVAALVFLAGIIAAPGKSLADLADIDADRDGPLSQDDFETFPDDTFIFTEATARRVLYHDCDSTVAAEAIGRLRRQRSMWKDVSPFAAWPATKIRSIVCRQDRVVNPPWSERVARERLGTQPLFLDGGHSPMLSRPHELALLLHALG